eukprot:6480031-Amphidinium_carterae.2
MVALTPMRKPLHPTPCLGYMSPCRVLEVQLMLTFDLGQSLGIFFDEERLLVEECAEGSQAESLGVPAGAVAVSVGGKAVSTPEQLI